MVFCSNIDDALIVGQTANVTTMHPSGTIRGGVRIIGQVGGAKMPQVRRTTFVNQAPAAVYVEGGHVMPGNLFEEITRIGTPIPVFLRDRLLDHTWSGGLLDIDGSLTGKGKPTLVTGQPVSSESLFMSGWGTFAAGVTSVSAVAPSGTYFIRMAALNACGMSVLSNQVIVTVP